MHKKIIRHLGTLLWVGGLLAAIQGLNADEQVSSETEEKCTQAIQYAEQNNALSTIQLTEPERHSQEWLNTPEQSSQYVILSQAAGSTQENPVYIARPLASSKCVVSTKPDVDGQ